MCPLLATQHRWIHPLQAIWTYTVYKGYVQWICPHTLATSMSTSKRTWTYPPDTSTRIWTCPNRQTGYIQRYWDIPAGHIQQYWDMSIFLGDITQWTCPVASGHTHWICPVALGHTGWTYPHPLGHVHIIMDTTQAVGYSPNSRDMSIYRGHIHSPGKYPSGYDQTAGCIQLLQKLLPWIHPIGWISPDLEWTLPPLVLSNIVYKGNNSTSASTCITIVVDI